MYLHGHFGLQVLLFQAFLDTYHGDFDDVGGCALDGGVDGIALGKAPHDSVLGVDIGLGALATKQGFHIAHLLGTLNAGVHVSFYIRIGDEIAINQFLCFPTGDAQAVGKAED